MSCEALDPRVYASTTASIAAASLAPPASLGAVKYAVGPTLPQVKPGGASEPEPAQCLRRWLRRMTARPHVSSSSSSPKMKKSLPAEKEKHLRSIIVCVGVDVSVVVVVPVVVLDVVCVDVSDVVVVGDVVRLVVRELVRVVVPLDVALVVRVDVGVDVGVVVSVEVLVVVRLVVRVVVPELVRVVLGVVLDVGVVVCVVVRVDVKELVAVVVGVVDVVGEVVRVDVTEVVRVLVGVVVCDVVGVLKWHSRNVLSIIELYLQVDMSQPRMQDGQHPFQKVW